MSKPPQTIVAAVLPQEFEDRDASGVITMAIAAVAFMSAIGNEDQDTLHALLSAAAASYVAMPESAQQNLRAGAIELLESTKAGKKVMFLGGFRRQADA